MRRICHPIALRSLIASRTRLQTQMGLGANYRSNDYLCHRVSSRGFMTMCTLPLCIMGLGHAHRSKEYPGTLNHLYPEEGARAFYGHWKALLMDDRRGQETTR